jgi:K+-transporting ATPase ATPase C chain
MKTLRQAFMLFLGLTILTGLVYPLAITLIAKGVFPSQADGSLIRQGDRIVGSRLIGQEFTQSGYFWGRPSATAEHAYNAAASSGSNQGPNHPDFEKALRERIDVLRRADPGNRAKIPTELVTASGSGLDPHISVASAEYQIGRVSRARGMSDQLLRKLIADHTEGRQFGVLGEPVVNVLKLNLALDKMETR